LTDWLGDTAARVPTKQIPREQGTLNGEEPHKTLYQQTWTINVGETHDFFACTKGTKGSFALAELVARC